MDIHISTSDGSPIYEQIARQIKGQILSGVLKPGDALPSLRLLARELRISLITTQRAYEELEREGFIVTVAGKGCFVAGENLEALREERLRRLESDLTRVVQSAHSAGVGIEELIQTLRLLYGEEKQ
ncbi:MAG TPA: GntR family transcriptional regulator [Candidatus Faecaligallichristensenella faecipullorum]|mgnify:CR=1 FL=1|nr:GntR family transcriptional regulator [Candidatus Faecaligallichristensenella faecipullorum]